MFMLCCCCAQTNTYNLVTFYTHLSGDVSLIWKLAHKLIKQRCNCPGQLATFEHWTNFSSRLVQTNFITKRRDHEKVHVWLDYNFSKIAPRVVTKISSCRVNTTSRQGIKRLGISFGSIFLLFSNKSSRGPLS